jgi:hypothetical protein
MSLFLSIDEDQIGDPERSHTHEQVGYAVFAGPFIYPPDDCPTIINHPADETVSEGDDVTFAVAAIGASPLMYQWYKDGDQIPGATESSHTVDAAVEDDAGEYYVVVTNDCGSETSEVATLTVLPAASGAQVWMSFKSSAEIPGLVEMVADEDIVAYDLSTGTWSLIFDGSDMGLESMEIDALAVTVPEDVPVLLLSFKTAGTIPGLLGGPDGTNVDDSDIVMFTPTSLGWDTAGEFSFYFDGSDVGLTRNQEDIDALALADDGRLIISTIGPMSENGTSGDDSDLFLFTDTSRGSNTTGTFEKYFDGSDVGLGNSGNEDIDAAGRTSSGLILLSTLGGFAVAGLTGADEDVFGFDPASLGESTSGTFAMFLDLGALGIYPGEDVGSVEFLELDLAGPNSGLLSSGNLPNANDSLNAAPFCGVFGPCGAGASLPLMLGCFAWLTRHRYRGRRAHSP